MACIAKEPGPSEASSSPTRQLLMRRQFSSKSLCYDSENEGQEEEGEEQEDEDFELGPLLPLMLQLEKDKEDESLRRWKEKLLGSVPLDLVEGSIDPEVQVMSLSILSAGRPDITISLPLAKNTRSHLFSLKEGSSYRLKFTFLVRRNIVSGLTHLHTVWKNGIRVDSTRYMLGTFSPQIEPYTYLMEEETTPCGILARGNYTAKMKFVDDDGRCYLEIQHTFDIRKEWCL